MITLFTIDCPSCLRLEKKLNENNISYNVCKDTDLMASLGMTSMPVLQINDNTFLNFKEAVKWINDQKIGD